MILSPVNMVALMILGICIKFEIPILSFVGILSPFFIFTAVYFIYKVFIKRDSDVDLSKLRMRRHLGVTAFVGFVISFIISHQYYSFLDGNFLRAGLIIFISGLVTFKWKISFHAIGYTSFCFTFIELFGTPWLLTLFGLPLVFWARIYLRKHTFAQLSAGTILSGIIIV